MSCPHCVQDAIIEDTERTLTKYIQHVGELEGVDYLRPSDRTQRFTDEEWELLKRLQDRIIRHDQSIT